MSQDASNYVFCQQRLRTSSVVHCNRISITYCRIAHSTYRRKIFIVNGAIINSIFRDKIRVIKTNDINQTFEYLITITKKIYNNFDFFKDLIKLEADQIADGIRMFGKLNSCEIDEMRLRAQSYAVQEFSVNNMVNKYTQVISEVCS